MTCAILLNILHFPSLAIRKPHRGWTLNASVKDISALDDWLGYILVITNVSMLHPPWGDIDIIIMLPSFLLRRWSARDPISYSYSVADPFHQGQFPSVLALDRQTHRHGRTDMDAYAQSIRKAIWCPNPNTTQHTSNHSQLYTLEPGMSQLADSEHGYLRLGTHPRAGVFVSTYTYRLAEIWN